MRFSSLPPLVIHHGLRVLSDLLACLRFFTRLPIAAQAFEPAWNPASFGRALRLAPLAGLVVGGIAAVVLDIGMNVLDLPGVVAAGLALSAQILVSGGLHEDGLADVADGFGGGGHRARKLEIMRDSRLGTFGALAVILSVVLRIAAIAALLDRYGPSVATGVLPAAAAASRGFCLVPLALLRPARADGLAHAAGVLSPLVLAGAIGTAIFLGMVVAFAGGVSEIRALAACGAALCASIAMTLVAHHQIGGHTGDVAGAAQQVAEIAYLVAVLAAPGLG